jgi:hypothetical protein
MKPTPVKIRSAEEAYDYLGRKLPKARKVELTRAPVFLLLPRGGSKDLAITPSPAKPKFLEGKASSVVLQFIGKTDFKQSAYKLDDTNQLKLVAYNFGDKPVRGKLNIEGGTAAINEIEIAPGAREERTIKLSTKKVTAKLDIAGSGHAIVAANVLHSQLKN